MKAFIFWTALISIVSGVGLQFDGLARQLMPGEQPGMLLHLFGAMAIFIGATLILCARDLRARASIVMWEALLRLAGGGLLLGYGLSGDAPTLIASGLFDGLIGIIYLVGLPRTLGEPLADLLLDRRRA